EAELRNEMRIELKRLHASNDSTTIYVTHDQLEALTMADRVGIMHQGTLQQLGTPEDVYRRPANRFVATFVGEPPMNIVQASVNGGRVAIGDYALERVPPADLAAIEAAASSAGGTVDVGVRPDDFRLGGPDEPGIAGRIRIRENLGDTTLLAVDTEGDRLRLRSGAGLGVREGENVRLHPRADRIHFFDAATGIAVGRSAGSEAD
ncbi:MAG: ABC transporter ATP-binding protein, partial [Chloroflexi bacterium]|nr:ABC transporter ATP-binding protein [Chloroflexota bacterium]